jgi:hypothetical protein
MFLTPVLFAGIGTKISLPQMTGSLLLFSALLLVVSIVTKIIGCGLGAKLCRFADEEALRVGVGMVLPRRGGADRGCQGMTTGLMREELFGAVVIMWCYSRDYAGIAQTGVQEQQKGLRRSGGQRAGRAVPGGARLRSGVPDAFGYAPRTGGPAKQRALAEKNAKGTNANL